MNAKWRPVGIPDDLYQQILEILREDKTYSSVAEFVRDAIRQKIANVRISIAARQASHFEKGEVIEE